MEIEAAGGSRMILERDFMKKTRKRLTSKPDSENKVTRL